MSVGAARVPSTPRPTAAIAPNRGSGLDPSLVPSPRCVACSGRERDGRRRAGGAGARDAAGRGRGAALPGSERPRPRGRHRRGRAPARRGGASDGTGRGRRRADARDRGRRRRAAVRARSARVRGVAPRGGASGCTRLLRLARRARAAPRGRGEQPWLVPRRAHASSDRRRRPRVPRWVGVHVRRHPPRAGVRTQGDVHPGRARPCIRRPHPCPRRRRGRRIAWRISGRSATS